MWYYIQANKKSHGALAQLGAHDTGSVGVTGSSPVCSTSKKGRIRVLFCWCFCKWKGIEAALRKRAGGSFLAVTEYFCKAQRNDYALMLCKNQEESRMLVIYRTRTYEKNAPGLICSDTNTFDLKNSHLNLSNHIEIFANL